MPLVADASNAAAVEALFEAATLALGGAPDVVVYNASQRVRGAFVEVDAEAVARAVDLTAIAAFRVAQQAVRRMVPAFAPYPCFVAGPYRDYSARWFGNHERLHDPRFRNSFLPQRTNIFAGFRTAATYN